jgi:aerobic carbon-monoxide dehydrogenase medium subunit
MFGVGNTPARAGGAEAALAGAIPSSDDFAAAGQVAAAATDPIDDIHATGRQRQRIIAHLASRAMQSAYEEARSA